jgi:hypothetical protein
VVINIILGQTHKERVCSSCIVEIHTVPVAFFPFRKKVACEAMYRGLGVVEMAQIKPR